jgi:uncharacterized SAM-binding protein YcdF (DUF218 family)
MNILLTIAGFIVALPLGYYIWMHTTALHHADADALIVLGYRCDNDEMHTLLRERLDTALWLMDRHRYRSIILSGGSVGSTKSEAEIMREYLIHRGVKPELLVIETWSCNTVQNMVNCGLLMKERGLETCLVVSNSFHIRRMKYIVKSLGMEVLFYASRKPANLAGQIKLTWQEIRAFRLTLPWLDKVAGMGERKLMGKI